VTQNNTQAVDGVNQNKNRCSDFLRRLAQAIAPVLCFYRNFYLKAVSHLQDNCSGAFFEIKVETGVIFKKMIKQ